ncbi:subtilisin-like protease [Mycena alexandri]|uniref:Subtilisin-like protease n=1 Tax=Mycena alexandri TaxID=1745969 RepID=A0AAD6SHD6_9AGAR|nr:subtilisin-like protease [Mycena alexandri]
MRSAFGVTLLGAGMALASTPVSSLIAQAGNKLLTVPNRFIVEFQSSADLPQTRRSTGAPENIYESLRERKISFDIHHEYNSPGLFVGVSLTLNNAQDVASLRSTAGVVAIRPVKLFDRPSPIDFKNVSDSDSGLPDSEGVHIITGVDRLHAQGITGHGVKIGIIDTGVDYTHEYLGAGFGPGFKVAGGYDLVGDAYTGANMPVPDADPLDQCAGIGTHVAGIIACNPNNPFNVSGVAYDAEIYAFRIFGCLGGSAEDVIVAGLLKAADADMDILTLSLGGLGGWTEGTAAVVASRIAASGKIVTIAAGNAGDAGPWYSANPGNAIDAISVASSDSPIIPLQSLTLQGSMHAPIVYFSSLPLPVNGSLPLYATSKNTTVADDACNPLAASTPDLSTFVVLVRRATCAVTVQLAHLAAFNASVALIYDDGTGFTTAISVGKFKAVLIQASDGVFLAQQLATGTAVNVTFPQEGALVQFPDPKGGLVSAFTSYGPTEDLFFKPAITAPGGHILSTWPVPLGGWALLSGTSMATPFMAGSAALLLSVKGKSAEVVATARSVFQSTANPLASSHTDGALVQTTTQQGAGLIQVYDALFATTIISPAELLLNDTAHFVGTQKFAVTNTGKSPKTYTLKHSPVGTAVTVPTGSILPASGGPIPLSADYASVSFDEETFTLNPGQTHEVVATFTPPQVDATTFPVYSGFIHVVSDAEDVHASYMGLAASIIDKAVIDTSTEALGIQLPLLDDPSGTNEAANYTFVNGDEPFLLWRLAFGTAVLRVDLVTADTTLPGAVHGRGIVPIFTFPQSQNGGTFSNINVVGPILEHDYAPRNDGTSSQDLNFVSGLNMTNTFANGTVIPNGSYKVLIRALRVTGDPDKEADYDAWLSQTMGVFVT